MNQAHIHAVGGLTGRGATTWGEEVLLGKTRQRQENCEKERTTLDLSPRLRCRCSYPRLVCVLREEADVIPKLCHHLGHGDGEVQWERAEVKEP